MTELAHDGDEAARSVLAEIGRRLGYGLVGVVNVFNPEVIVIGGGAIAAGELLLAPARTVVIGAGAAAGSGGGPDRAGPLRRRVGDAGRGAAGAGCVHTGVGVVSGGLDVFLVAIGFAGDAR